MKRLLFAGFMMMSFFSTIFAISIAERNLKKVYQRLGLENKKVGAYIQRIKDAVRALSVKTIEQQGIPTNELASIIADGMLLELCERGEDTAVDAAKNCISKSVEHYVKKYINKSIAPGRLHYSYEMVFKLLLTVRRYIFIWLYERLSLYEENSFKHAYALYESNPDLAKKVWGFRDDNMDTSESDFIYDIPFKKDVERELLEKSICFKHAVKYDSSQGLTNSFELLRIDDKSSTF